MSTTPPRKGSRHLWHNVDSLLIRGGDPLTGVGRTYAFVAGEHPQHPMVPHDHQSSVKITLLTRSHLRVTTFVDPKSDDDGEDSLGVAVRGTIHTCETSELAPMRRRSPAIYSVSLSPDSLTLDVGQSLVVPHDDIRSVQWGAGAVWIVEEGPPVTSETTMFLRDGVDQFDEAGVCEPMSEYDYRRAADRVWRLLAQQRNLN